MRIHIVKQPRGTIKCEFTKDQKAEPEVIYLDTKNLAMIRSLLDTIEKANVMEFVLDL